LVATSVGALACVIIVRDSDAPTPFRILYVVAGAGIGLSVGLLSAWLGSAKHRLTTKPAQGRKFSRRLLSFSKFAGVTLAAIASISALILGVVWIVRFIVMPRA